MSFFPACTVALIVRLEDFGATDVPPPPDKPPQLRTGKQDPALQFEREQSPTGSTRFVLTAGGSKLPGGPQGQTASDDNRTFRIEGVIPRSCTVSRNGVRTADTASIEIAFDDLPLDPRVVRALGVEVYMGTITAEQFAAGVAGKSGQTSEQSAAPLNVLPYTFTDEQGRERSNKRFSGFADRYANSRTRDGAPVVRIECTDNTRLLIGQDAPPKLGLDPKKPIDEAVAAYLANFPQMLGLAVEYRPDGEAPTLEKVLAKGAFRPNIGPPPAGGGSKLTVWDYLTDACGSLGLLVRVEDAVVVIQRPRTLYATSGATRPDDPFTGRKLPGGRVINTRLLVHGRNILDLEFERDFGRGAPQNIEVRCFSEKQKKTLIARYPQKGDRVSQPLPGNATEQKWTVLELTGINDETTLRAIAQGAYEAQGRQELMARVTTRSLASYGGSNLDPDLLDVLAGDGIDVEVARETEGLSSTGEVEEAIATAAEQFMLVRGFDPGFAKAYGEAMKNAAFQRSFRCRNVRMQWSKDEGIEWDAELANYLVVRSNKELPAGEEVTVDSPTAEPAAVTVEDA